MSESQPYSASRATIERVASSVWRLCDVLRDDGITYHQYINELSYLLFLKMAQESGSDSGLPPHCRWDALSSANEGEQYPLYMKLLVDLGSEGPAVVREIFAHPTSLLRKPESLRMLVDGIDAIDWHSATREGFGDIYEELLKYSAEKRSGAGQYFTPRHLVESIVRVTQPGENECIQDPALGTAGFLVAAHQHLREHGGHGARYVGVELVPDNFRIALMNTFIHEMTGEFHLGDSLAPLGERLPPADLVLTNPPFGAKRGGAGPRRALPHPTTNKQFAFLQHVLLGLAPGGRAAIVVPDNVLFEDGVGRRVRRDLVETANLHTLLRLPAGIFYAAGVKTNVLFFNREGPTKALWVYDARSGASSITKRDRPLERSHFDEFERCYGTDPYAASRPASLESSVDRWRAFDIASIRRQEYALDRLRWLPEDSEDRGDVELEEALGTLSTQLQTATDELGGLVDYLAHLQGRT